MPLDSEDSNNSNTNGNLWSRMWGNKSGNSARDALEEYVERVEGESTTDSASKQEKLILANVLKMRDVKVADVMVPRADIVAIDVNIGEKELLQVFAEKQCSRIPVYKDSLDNILGTIHVKDVLSSLAEDMIVRADKLIVELPVVSPTMDVLDLVLYMRQERRHMALVIDEHGGVDGLVTISDVIEEIVGDIDDEHVQGEDPEILEQDDGTLIADARFDLEEFEDRYGKVFSEPEREESDTLGGMVCNLAGRVPAKGEVLTHPSGVLFEVLDGDPRRVSLLRIHNTSQL